ncbi:hypothetical protein [Streptomyces longisporus]|uniref:hypothetical protein n=1 Tax=Streptomyces longisporus TaxID=1948 RepID=UPI0031D12D66
MHSKRAVPKRRIPAADLIAAAAVGEVTSTVHSGSAFRFHSYYDSGGNGAHRNTESTIQRAKIANHLKEFNAAAQSANEAAVRAKSA